jgi:hypothetical protein
MQSTARASTAVRARIEENGGKAPRVQTMPGVADTAHNACILNNRQGAADTPWRHTLAQQSDSLCDWRVKFGWERSLTGTWMCGDPEDRDLTYQPKRLQHAIRRHAVETGQATSTMHRRSSVCTGLVLWLRQHAGAPTPCALPQRAPPRAQAGRRPLQSCLALQETDRCW